MKQMQKIVMLVLVMLLGLCCTAQAITQSEIEGVWQVDLVPVLMTQGYTAEQCEVLISQAEMAMTMEFTADQKYILRVTANTVPETREEYSYMLLGNDIVLDSGLRSSLTRSGDILTMVDPDGTTTTMTYIDTDAPAADAAHTGNDLVGLWKLDIDTIAQMAGISPEEYEQARPILEMMTGTMEFTADGRCVITMDVLGQQDVTESAYEVKDGKIYLDGDPAEYTIVGDTLTIIEGEMTMTLIRAAQEAPEASVAPVTAVMQADDGLVGVWKLDVEAIVQLAGIPQEEYEQLKPIFALITGTMEFTADGRCVITIDALGQQDVTESAYEVKDGKIYLDGAPADYTIVGDTLTIIEGEVTMTLTRVVQEASVAPVTAVMQAEGGLVGVWKLDIEAIVQLLGIPQEEYEQMKAFLALITGTMEFTADGRCVITIDALGQQDVTESAYEVKDGKIYLDGAPADYTIVGDTLTIIEGEVTMTLTRVKEAVPQG
ncbi:MAG: hypothetical protein IJB81_03700 [Clostridia bacterium]|nr:hypothetical protein [Clostridia bacterium]